MPKQIISSSKAPTTGFTDKAKAPPIVQAIKAGPFLYVSGQGPLDPATKEVVAGDIERAALSFVDELRAVVPEGMAVDTEDERLTSALADRWREMSGAKGKFDRDAAAAAAILETYIERNFRKG